MMLRICAALIAITLVPALPSPAAMASVKELKPKFGDIGGITYSDVSGNRDACLSALRSKIHLCRSNTNFESNTKNRKYAGCLPIFRQQAQSCVEHFTRMQSRCHGSGRVDVPDFTGFSCEVTATVVEEGGEPERGTGPEIAPMDGRMKARTRVNLRVGPGTNHPVVGALSTDQEVQVTGRSGDWLRIALRGRTAFVHGQFMVAVAAPDPARQDAGSAAGPSPKCAGMSRGATCWLETTNKQGCYVWRRYFLPYESVTWSGACPGGVASGKGTLVQSGKGSPLGTWSGRPVFTREETGALARGKKQGNWVERNEHGDESEGLYLENKIHGRWIYRGSDGICVEHQYDNGAYVRNLRKDC